MKHRLATMSQTRVWARELIDQVIADNVFGPIGCLPPEDLNQIRQILRSKAPLAGLSAWEKRILREEWRATLGYPLKRRPKMIRRRTLTELDILPSMVPWAREKGLIPKTKTETAPA